MTEVTEHTGNPHAELALELLDEEVALKPVNECLHVLIPKDADREAHYRVSSTVRMNEYVIKAAYHHSDEFPVALSCKQLQGSKAFFDSLDLAEDDG